MIWPAVVDRPLAEVLRAFPAPPPWLEARARFDVRALALRAELHGLAGLVEDVLASCDVELPSDLTEAIDVRRVARELDHAAHLGVLAAIDVALAREGLKGVLLKGPLFAERFYPRPSARATSDVDLLVDECALDRVANALEPIGYRRSSSPEEARFRREHHHLHLEHASALPLELHFHAYQGFGSLLPSEALVARSIGSPIAAHAALRVLSPEDELAYLAVHAAAHRFVRLGWLFDMKLLVATMSPVQIEEAANRARGWSFGRALACAGQLLSDVLGVDRERLAALGTLGALRAPLVRRVTAEPESALARSATRFLYTVSLCDSLPAALRYARRSSSGHAGRLIGLGR